MLYKTSVCNKDKNFILQELGVAPLQTMFFKIDEESILSTIEVNGCYDKSFNMKQGETSVRMYMFPVRYIHSTDVDIDNLIKCRDAAITMMYKIWCRINDKQVLVPYTTKTFMDYIEELGFFNSDYVVIKEITDVL